MDPAIFDTQEYKRSRRGYSLMCLFEYLIALLVSDAYLARLLTAVGMSDTTVGILSSLISLAFLFQLVPLLFSVKNGSVKQRSILWNSLSSLLFSSLFIIPFLPWSGAVKKVAVTVLLLAAYFCLYFVANAHFQWGNSFVAPSKRGTFTAGKEMLSLGGGMVFSALMGQVFDRCEAAGKQSLAFLITGIVGLVITFLIFVSLNMVGEGEPQGNEKKEKTVDVLRLLFKNRDFLSVLLLSVLYYVGRYTTVGFLGTFKTKELLYSVGTVQFINIAANAVRFAVSKPFGKLADRTSFANSLSLGLLLQAIAFAFAAFASPASRWCIIVYTVIFAVSMASTNQCFFNILYGYVEPEHFAQANAVKNSISGLIGFLVALPAGRLLSAIQSSGNYFLGIHVYGQQVLAAISCLLILAASLYARFVLGKRSFKVR